MILLLIALLQTPDDLATFLAQLDKDRAAGTAPAELIARIDDWAPGRPPEILPRLAWNRALLESLHRIDPIRSEWLKRRVGKAVTLGGLTGTVREVKPGGVVIEASGEPKEIRFASLAPDDGLGEMEKEGLLPAKSIDEAVLRFASGKAEIGLALARKLEGPGQDRALAAFVGREIQNADRDLADGKLRVAADRLAAGWTRHADLMDAGKGALRVFVEAEFLEALYKEADKMAAKDRKGARKLLDLVPALSKAAFVIEDLEKRHWNLVERNQWHSVRLEYLAPGPTTISGSTIVMEYKGEPADPTRTFYVNPLPVPWKEVSGFRAKIRAGSIEYVDMRLGFGIPAKDHCVAVNAVEARAYYVFLETRNIPSVKESRAIMKRPEYEFRFDLNVDLWRASLDNTVLKTFKAEEAASQISFVYTTGKCELLSLDIRKK